MPILPLDAGVDIRKVQLRRRRMTVTQVYDRSGRSTSESASTS